MPKRKTQFRPLYLFEGMTEEPRKPSMEVVPLVFESYQLRMIIIKGEPWWVASDPCKILGLAGDPGQHLRRLDDDEKGLIPIQTQGGEQKALAVNEFGLYSLILASRKPEAKQFKRWITHDVIPTIRRTGTYTMQPQGRVAKVANRLKVDTRTAKVRCDQYDINLATNKRLASEGAIPRDFAEWHNACYRGQFGVEAPRLREALGLKGCRQTPLDRMDELVLSQNHHAKSLAERQILETAHDLTRSEQCSVLEETAREIAQADFARLGEGYVYGVVDDPRRGKVLDVQKQLPAR